MDVPLMSFRLVALSDTAYAYIGIAALTLVIRFASDMAHGGGSERVFLPAQGFSFSDVHE